MENISKENRKKRTIKKKVENHHLHMAARPTAEYKSRKMKKNNDISRLIDDSLILPKATGICRYYKAVHTAAAGC